MTIRVHRKNRFTTVPNEIIEFKEMSFESRFVLIYLLSRPDGWVVRNSDVEAQSKAGKDKVSSILREIQCNGFMFRWKERVSGKYCWRSEVFESQKDCADWLAENPHQTGFDPHGKNPDQSGFTSPVLTPMEDDSPERIYQPGFDPHIVKTELVNTDPEIFTNSVTYTLSGPECVCEELKKDVEPSRSFALKIKSQSISVFSETIGGDNFSAAAPQKTSVEGFPVGPWGRSLFEIDGGFMGWMIALWKKGDGRQAQAFGKMADEEVRGCLQKYWKKDWDNLSIDWNAYSCNTQRLVETVSDRMDQGIEISPQEQKILTDRVMGPEHLRSQAPHSDPQQGALNPVRIERALPPGAVPLIAANELSAIQLEETRKAIEAARSSLKMPENNALFRFGKPNPEFSDWLRNKAKNHRIEGMTIAATINVLCLRKEYQAEYLQSLEVEF
jgi:hypothetical protein